MVSKSDSLMREIKTSIEAVPSSLLLLLVAYIYDLF